VRRFVQTHVDEILVNSVICIGLLVVGVLRILDLRECVFGWVSDNLLLDLVELGRIVEYLYSIKIGVRLEQVIAPGSLRDVSEIRNAKNAKAEESSRLDISIGR
jgi:hypothetical protein